MENYRIYTDFVNNHFKDQFKNIKEGDEDVLLLNKINRKNKQFLVATNLISLKHLYTTSYFTEMLGYSTAKVDPGFFMKIIHPDDFKRYQRMRSKVMDIALTIFNNKEGKWLISANFRARKSNGDYIEILYQCYFYFLCADDLTSDSDCPDCKRCNVVMNMVITNVTGLIDSRKTVHQYSGDDCSLFCYPDKQLLSIGTNLTNRELELIGLIETGMSSDLIADKLFLSVKTVNTHRSNILKKTGKSSILEAIYELKQSGVI